MVWPPMATLTFPVRPFLRFILITTLAGLGLACVAVALLPAAKYLSYASSSVARDISLSPLDQRSYVYASDGSLLTTFQAEVDRQPVALSTIPADTITAVLAVEDAGFFAHAGVNLRSTLRAFMRDVDSGGVVQGGSTITQQVIKSEYGNEQTIGRKAREAVLARRLEKLMSKEEILERYLNTVYLGNGAYGLQAGAETYFGVGVADLDIGQSALLAGMIANPSAFDPLRHPEDAKARRSVALGRLVAVGRLTDVDQIYLGATPLPTVINQVLPTTEGYFAEKVKQQLLDDPQLGATPAEREYQVFRGGLKIYTTLEPRAQLLALTARNEVLEAVAPAGTPVGVVPIAPNPETGVPRNATAAVVSVEPGTGAVRALVGGAGFDQDKFDVATQGLRSGGSTFKIFVLMALLEHGYSPNDSVNGSGACTFKDIPGMVPNPYKVENFGNSGGGSGTITSQTLRSSNCAFVRLGQIVGIDNVVEQARRMGITTPLEGFVSTPLGTEGVHPIEMAAAVAAIAADGMYNAPYFVDRVEDPAGKVVLAHAPNPRRASSAQTARLAADVLEKNVQGGTGTKARISGQHAAGKTGTAQNAGNGWFVGFTPYMATAVWIGSPADNFEVRIGGTGITGGSYPAEIWGRYMRAWHEGLPEKDFVDAAPFTRSSRYLRVDSQFDASGGGYSTGVSRPPARPGLPTIPTDPVTSPPSSTIPPDDPDTPPTSDPLPPDQIE